MKKKYFSWQGIDEKHQKQKGYIKANSRILAKLLLETQGIQITKISKHIDKKINSKIISLFFQQLSNLLEANLSLLQSLIILRDSAYKPNMSRMLSNIITDIKHGNTFSESLNKYPKYFDQITCQLLNIAEQIGFLAAIIKKIAIRKQLVQKLKKKFYSAFIYPCILIIVVISISFLFLLFIIPQFSQLFSSAKVQLPFLTRIVICFSNLLQKHCLGIILCLFLTSITGIIYYKKNIKKISKLIFKLPLIGNIYRFSILAGITDLLSISLETGATLHIALQASVKVINNAHCKHIIQQLAYDIQCGESLQISMQQQTFFPKIMVQMVAIGEETGKLISMLQYVSDYYANIVDQSINIMTQILEPLIILFLSLIIGFFVIAMYLPIFKLGVAI